MPNGRNSGRRRGRRPKRRSDEKGGRTVQTAAPALFAFMGPLSSSVGLSAWRWACASPRCGSRCFRSGQRKQIIRTHHRLEIGSDYIGLVPVVGLEPTRCCHQRILNPSRLPIPSYRQRNCKILYTTLKRLASLFDGGKSENNRLINIPFPVEMCYDNLDFITYPMEGFRR